MKPNKFERYEFFLFEGNQVMADRELPKLQSDGWRLAGDVSVKYSNQSGSMNRMLIPLKRLIEPPLDMALVGSHFEEYYALQEAALGLE